MIGNERSDTYGTTNHHSRCADGRDNLYQLTHIAVQREKAVHAFLKRLDDTFMRVCNASEPSLYAEDPDIIDAIARAVAAVTMEDVPEVIQDSLIRHDVIGQISYVAMRASSIRTISNQDPVAAIWERFSEQFKPILAKIEGRLKEKR